MEEKDFKGRTVIDLLKIHDIGDTADSLIALHRSLSDSDEMLTLLQSLDNCSFTSLTDLQKQDLDDKQEKEL